MLGFTAASYPCEDGFCEDVSETQQRADSADYGNGDGFKIDSSKPFNVDTRFFASKNGDGEADELIKIVTTLK